MTPSEIQALITDLSITDVQLAGLLGVDARSVRRYLAGENAPCGSALVLLRTYRAALTDAGPARAEVVTFLREAACLGGLGLLTYRLLGLIGRKKE